MGKAVNKPLRAGIWYTICNFLVKGLVFLTSPFFNRLMTKADIGSFSNIQSWFSILAIITTVELHSSVSLAQFDYKDELDDYVSSCLVLGTMVTAVFYGVVLTFHGFFEELFEMDFTTLNLIFIYLLVYPAIQMFQIRNQVRYTYKASVSVSMTSSCLSVLISLLAVFLCEDKLKGRTFGYYIPLICVSAAVYVYLLIKGRKISTKYWKFGLAIALPLIWHLLAGNILSSSDRIMITKFMGEEMNAMYTVAYSCGMVVSLLWVSMNSAWSPWAYQQMDKKEYSNLRENSKPYTIFFLIVALGFMLIGPEFLFIIGGENFTEAKYVIPPVMLGYVFQFIYSLYVNIEFYHKKQKNIALGTIIAAIANIVLNAIFIPKFGYVAAAYTTLAGYVLLFAIHYMFVKRLGKTDWYDTKFFMSVLGIASLTTVLVNFLYGYTLIRWIVIGVLCIAVLIFVIKKRREILAAIKSKSLPALIDAVKIRRKEK